MDENAFIEKFGSSVQAAFFELAGERFGVRPGRTRIIRKILCGLKRVIRRAAVLNLPETGLGDNWRMCQVAEIPMFTTRGSVHGWNDRRRDSLFRKASHRSTEANVFGFGLQTAL